MQAVSLAWVCFGWAGGRGAAVTGRAERAALLCQSWASESLLVRANALTTPNRLSMMEASEGRPRPVAFDQKLRQLLVEGNGTRPCYLHTRIYVDQVDLMCDACAAGRVTVAPSATDRRKKKLLYVSSRS